MKVCTCYYCMTWEEAAAAVPGLLGWEAEAEDRRQAELEADFAAYGPLHGPRQISGPSRRKRAEASE